MPYFATLIKGENVSDHMMPALERNGSTQRWPP